jgi:hypothetical protein
VNNKPDNTHLLILVVLYGLLCLLIGVMSFCMVPRSWIFLPSAYSHDAQGNRVTQYAKPAPAYVPVYPNYRQRVYRHRDTFAYPYGDYDHWHVIETWESHETRP